MRKGAHAQKSGKRVNYGFAILGLLLLPVGVAGVFLPLLPGTPILILAAACFARSSPQLENFLVSHPQFGPPIQAWRERGAIPLRAKLFALIAMAASAVLAINSSAPIIGKGAALFLLAVAAIFVSSRPNQ